MKILMLTPYLPYPPSSGGQVRSYNLIKHLYPKHEITLFCYIRGDKERDFVPELQKYCQKVRAFERRQAWSPLNVLLSGVTTYPFLVAIYLSSAFRGEIEKELTQADYDLIHCENIYMMTNIPRTSLPIVLVDQTIEYLVYQHFVSSLKLVPLRLLLAIDVAKLKLWERDFWRKANKVVAVSQADKQEMLRLEPRLAVDLVPNGVDLEFFIPKKGWNNREKRILFVGNFKWLQNTEAAELLIAQVFPRVKSQIPQAKLWIVGQHIPERITSFKSSEIIVDSLPVEEVEAMRAAYHQASVFASPMSGPGGTRLKNLAAMASRLPIVTTRIGAEGIGIRDGREALIRDDVEGISNGIIEILADPDKAKELAQNARLLAQNEYSWERIAQKLESIYEEVVHRHS